MGTLGGIGELAKEALGTQQAAKPAAEEKRSALGLPRS